MEKTFVGQIPKDWEIVRAGHIFDIYGGTTPSTNNKEYWNGDILWVTPTDVTKLNNTPYLDDTEKKITEKAVRECSLKILQPGTLLLTSRATIGFTAINKKPVTINQGITALIPKKKDMVDVLFYNYYFRLLRTYLQQLGAGSTFKEISRSIIKKLKIPLPPLPEQKKIAEILSTVDKAIQKVDEAIAKTERLKKGLMQELLTKGIGHKEFKNTEIGRIPKEWKIVKLEDVAKVFDCKHRTPTYYSEGFPVLLPRNVQEGRISLEDAPRTSYEEYLDLTEKYKPARGDIIYTRNAKVGVAGMVMTNEEFALGQDLVGIRPLKKVESNYLLYVLNSSIIRRYLIKAQTGSTFKRINLSLIRKLKIPLPSLEEQHKIAEILSTVDRKLELERKRKEKLERIKKGLMNDLLTGRKRVRVEC